MHVATKCGNTRTMAAANITIPRDLMSALLDAFESLDLDTRRDRVLHDETILKVDLALQAKDAWLRAKAGI